MIGRALIVLAMLAGVALSCLTVYGASKFVWRLATHHDPAVPVITLALFFCLVLVCAECWRAIHDPHTRFDDDGTPRC